MRNTLLIAAALLVLLFVGGYMFFVSPKSKFTRVTVEGVSEASLSPDTAVVTLSVVTNGTQALAAQQDNAVRSEAVKKAIETVLGGETFEFSKFRAPVLNADPRQEPSRSLTRSLDGRFFL